MARTVLLLLLTMAVVNNASVLRAKRESTGGVDVSQVAGIPGHPGFLANPYPKNPLLANFDTRLVPVLPESVQGKQHR